MTIVRKPFPRQMLFVAAAVPGLVAFGVATLFSITLAYIVAANVFFLIYIALALAEMPLLTADFLAKNARRTDLPIQLIFLVTAVFIIFAVVSLFQLINASHSPHPAALLLSLAAIPLGWFTIHTMTALHYAHLYWFSNDGTKRGKPREGAKRGKPRGGLDFPGTEPPCGWDFLYFSTVIGMTAQTADTDITTSPMRRAVLLHSIVSFFFNTVIVAAAVNVAVSFGK